MQGGSGRVRVGDTDYRVVSADTMKLLSSVRRGAGDAEPPWDEAEPDSYPDRHSRQTGWLGRRVLGRKSPAGDDPGPGDLGRPSAGPPCCRPAGPAAHFFPKGSAWRLAGAAARRRTHYPRFSQTTIFTVIPAPCIRLCYTDVIVSIAIANTALVCKAFGQSGPGPG